MRTIIDIVIFAVHGGTALAGTEKTRPVGLVETGHCQVLAFSHDIYTAPYGLAATCEIMSNSDLISGVLDSRLVEPDYDAVPPAGRRMDLQVCHAGIWAYEVEYFATMDGEPCDGLGEAIFALGDDGEFEIEHLVGGYLRRPTLDELSFCAGSEQAALPSLAGRQTWSLA